MKLIYSKSIGLLLIIFVYSNCEQVAEKVPVSEVTATNLTSTPVKKSPITKPVKFTDKNDEIRYLIARLEEEEWLGATNMISPISWSFHFTEPMRKIIDIGKPAQNELLKNIDNPKIKDQIIILLGGVGDEKAVEPMINAMIAKEEIESTPDAGKINLSANIALTNLTVATVIWHHGGGIVETKPPPNSKQLWADWWQKNKDTFNIEKITQSRRYSNYPNYGIYRGKD